MRTVDLHGVVVLAGRVVGGGLGRGGAGDELELLPPGRLGLVELGSRLERVAREDVDVGLELDPRLRSGRWLAGLHRCERGGAADGTAQDEAGRGDEWWLPAKTTTLGTRRRARAHGSGRDECNSSVKIDGAPLLPFSQGRRVRADWASWIVRATGWVGVQVCVGERGVGRGGGRRRDVAAGAATTHAQSACRSAARRNLAMSVLPRSAARTRSSAQWTRLTRTTDQSCASRTMCLPPLSFERISCGFNLRKRKGRAHVRRTPLKRAGGGAKTHGLSELAETTTASLSSVRHEARRMSDPGETTSAPAPDDWTGKHSSIVAVMAVTSSRLWRICLRTRCRRRQQGGGG